MSEDKLRKKRWLVWGMGVSIVVLLFTPFLLFRAVNKAAFERKVAELKAAGQPVSLDDLEAAYVLPEGVENAADLYLKAFRAYVDPNSEEQKLLPICGTFVRTDDMPPYPAEVMEAVRVRLEENAECLELLERAARMEHCLLPRRRQPGFFFANDSLQPLRKTCTLLAERNLYLAQSGQVDALYESTLTLFGLTGALTEQPMIIDHLVMAALEGLAVSDLENSLNAARFTDIQLGELQRRLGAMQPLDTYARAVLCERAGTIDMFSEQGLVKSGFLGSGFVPALTAGLLTYSGLKDRDAVLLLDYYERQLQILQLPAHEQTAEMNKLRAEVDSHAFIHYLLAMMAPSDRISGINLRVEGGIRCAETALAVERYRLKYGKLPDGLGDLVPEFLPEVYLDPFDGKPLRYVLRAEGGYMIYCIGEDGKDQGGKDREEMIRITGSRATEDCDWPFTVRR